MIDELKPCPFCGDEPALSKSQAPFRAEYMVICARGCGACNGWKDTAEEAITAWNTRHDPDELHIRPPVFKFAKLMEAKLKDNDHKGGWDQDTIEQLRYKLECEVIELKNVLECFDSPIEVIYECVDVANFAMMIADLTLRKPEEK